MSSESNLGRVEALNAGQSPIAERGLDDLLADGLGAGRLSFSADPATLHGCRLVIVAVGTLDSAGEWTDRLVREVVLAIAGDPAAPRAIVIRSTLLPGTAVGLAAAAAAVDPTVEVGFNPEFTRKARPWMTSAPRPDRDQGVRQATRSWRPTCAR